MIIINETAERVCCYIRAKHQQPYGHAEVEVNSFQSNPLQFLSMQFQFLILQKNNFGNSNSLQNPATPVYIKKLV